MLTVEEVKDALKESPLFEKWGDMNDLEEVIGRMEAYIDPFSLYNYNVSNTVGEVYIGS